MKYRYALIFLILLQLSAVIFPACVGYSDSFTVRVLDAKQRPIEGAEVWVKYDRGASFGPQYFTTPINKTGPDGTIHYQLLNQGTNTRTIDCAITINGSIGGQSKKVVVNALEHGPIVDVKLDNVYPVNFFVRDQFKAPLPGASVTLGNKTNRTDSFGRVKYFFSVGSYDYFASYKDAKQPGTLNISNDTEYEVIFPYYKVRVEVTDDFGEPLPVILTIFNTSNTLDTGVFESDKTFGESVPYTVDYKGNINESTIIPSVDPIVKIIYDIHSPVIGNIQSSMQNSRAKLSFPVSDPGRFPSGVDVSSVKVSYKLEPSDATTPWNQAVTFTTGRSTYTAEFPELPKNSIVRFRVELKDKAGNRAEIEGKFSTFSEANPENQTNNTQNQTNPQPGQNDSQGIPLIYILVGVIVVILVVFVVIRIKTKAG
ncbi:MAG: hypothetical protein U0R44_06320 [Candidatus Micrarchaeia archaeon]